MGCCDIMKEIILGRSDSGHKDHCGEKIWRRTGCREEVEMKNTGKRNRDSRKHQERWEEMQRKNKETKVNKKTRERTLICS